MINPASPNHLVPQYNLTESEVPPRFVTSVNGVHAATISLWEYRAVTIIGGGAVLVPRLNELGLLGWEAIQIDTRLESDRVRQEVLLKRPIIKDLFPAAEWMELQSRMIARQALRGGPITEEHPYV